MVRRSEEIRKPILTNFSGRAKTMFRGTCLQPQVGACGEYNWQAVRSTCPRAFGWRRESLGEFPSVRRI